ncbi:ComEC/Rec2 family competence protein [Actinomadura logoneensis]|uniref:ComEC/Rec2 family competence protein n=1 Tax=Actinomadura logoneensis TaxID=2293572 RepID=UPI001F47CA0D|nr:ComEC/Rec2 family competence protein [Actinomadura logoneensis]
MVGGVGLLCAAASATGVGLRTSAVRSGPVFADARAHRSAAMVVAVAGDPKVKRVGGRELVIVRARVERVEGREGLVRTRVPVLLLASGREWSRLIPSMKVRCAGRLVPPKHAELLAGVVLVRGPPSVVGGPSGLQRTAGAIRAKLRQAANVLHPDARGVLPAMVVGDTSRLDPDLAEDFTTAGLSHLLVVSGANLAIVVGAVLALCRMAGLGRRGAPIIAGLAVIGFVVVARPDPSVLRAAVMATVGLLALFTGRPRQGVPALAGAVLLLVLVDPELSRSYGFALSAAATAGLLILAPPWRERLRRRLPDRIADAVAVAVAAELAVAPILVMMSGELGVVSIAANLLADPAVAPATLFGAAGAVVAPFSPGLAGLILWPAEYPVRWIIWVARTASALPYATLPWASGALGAVGLLTAGAITVAMLRSRRLRLLFAAAIAGTLAGVVCMNVLAPGWPPPGWQLVACDVGQGDGLVLAAGPGSAVVVDAGPEPSAIDGCLRRLRVREVPLLVLTHPHADHINGVPGVRHGRRVGLGLVTPLGFGREARFAGGVPIRPAQPGETWHLGDLSLTVLAPPVTGPRLTAQGDGTIINNASIVLVASRPGFSALLPGDVETEAQEALVPSLPHVQVLKVPHHGSRSQHRPFLAAAHASIGLVSVGKDNDYGHPSPHTVGLLQHLGVRVLRTDQQGDIAVVRTRAGLATVARH